MSCAGWFFWFKLVSLTATLSFQPNSVFSFKKIRLCSKSRWSMWLQKQGPAVKRKTSHFCCLVILEKEVARFITLSNSLPNWL